MRYLTDCSFPGLDEHLLRALSREAQHDFGDPGYHLLASFSGHRIFGVFKADRPQVVRNWVRSHGGEITAIAEFEAEGELGKVRAQKR